MKKRARVKLGVLVICCSLGSLALPSAYGADHVDKKEIVKQARQAYYNLRSHGLLQFQANVQPDWRLLLKDSGDAAKVDETVKVLNQLHFSMSLDENGAVKVIHRSDASAENEKQFASAFGQMFDGMEQMTSGFFDTWSPFMLTSPLPAVESDYQLEDKGSEYDLTYKEGAADVETTLSKTLVINEIRVSDPAFRSSIKPQFKTSPQGFVLIGYDSTYVGITNSDNVKLTVQIDYREVAGQQLPHKLNLTGSSQGSPFAVEVVMSDYQVKNR